MAEAEEGASHFMELGAELGGGGCSRLGVGIGRGAEFFEAVLKRGGFLRGQQLALLGECIPEGFQLGSGFEEGLRIGWREEAGLNANALLKVFEEGVKAGLSRA